MPTGFVAGGTVTTGGATAIGVGGELVVLSSFGPTSLSRGMTKLPLASDGIGALPCVAKLLVSSGTGI